MPASPPFGRPRTQDNIREFNRQFKQLTSPQKKRLAQILVAGTWPGTIFELFDYLTTEETP